MYEPQVTIITPTYNVVDNSQVNDFDLMITMLGKQTYSFLDLLVIDNNSKDGTVDLLKEYKNEGSLAFYSEPDQGKFDAINKGLVRAKGKYVAFLSCDDFYHDIKAIENVVNFMEEEEADFCCFPSYCCQPDGSAFLFEPAILNTFQVVPCPRQAVIFRKEALQELGYFDAKFKLLADYDLIIRLILNGYAGVQWGDTLVTTKLGEKVNRYTTQAEAEFSHIFHKNFKTMYPMNEEVLERMVKISEIPRPLLDQLAQYFPDEEQEEFYQRYENMYNFRVQNS